MESPVENPDVCKDDSNCSRNSYGKVRYSTLRSQFQRGKRFSRKAANPSRASEEFRAAAESFAAI